MGDVLRDPSARQVAAVGSEGAVHSVAVFSTNPTGDAYGPIGSMTLAVLSEKLAGAGLADPSGTDAIGGGQSFARGTGLYWKDAAPDIGTWQAATGDVAAWGVCFGSTVYLRPGKYTVDTTGFTQHAVYYRNTSTGQPYLPSTSSEAAQRQVLFQVKTVSATGVILIPPLFYGTHYHV